jgi:hypothetical protein
MSLAPSRGEQANDAAKEDAMPFKTVRDEIDANERRAQEIAAAKNDDGDHGVIVDTVEQAMEGIRRPVPDDDEASAKMIERERLDNVRDEQDYEELRKDFDKS